MAEQKTGPEGIGGWMALFLLGQLVVIGVTIYKLPEAWSFLSDGTWDLGRDIAFLRPILVMETAAGLLQVFGPMVGILLTLRGSPATPRFWQGYLAALTIYAVLDILGAELLRAVFSSEEVGRGLDQANRENIQLLATCAIWIAYWRISRRVKNTFQPTSKAYIGGTLAPGVGASPRPGAGAGPVG